MGGLGDVCVDLSIASILCALPRNLGCDHETWFFVRDWTTPRLRRTPPKEGNFPGPAYFNFPPTEGWQAQPDGVVEWLHGERNEAISLAA